jgi:hypothetical protein
MDPYNTASTTTTSPTSVQTTGPSQTATAPPVTSGNLPTKAKVGIGIGCSVLGIIALAGIYFFMRKRRTSKAASAGTESENGHALHDMDNRTLRPLSSRATNNSTLDLTSPTPPYSAYKDSDAMTRREIETPDDPGRVWEQEPKTLMTLEDLEQKSLWVPRDMVGG